MDNNSAYNYFKKTKIFDLITPQTSDITYNGQGLFLQEINGQKRLSKLVLTPQEAFDLIKHLADLCGKNFNYSQPLLDLAFLNYRINAIHPSIAQVGYESVINFALRIASKHNRIQDAHDEYAPRVVFQLLKAIIHHDCSLLIGGLTGSGKSELQRYLIAQIDSHKRVIIIQDSAEIVGYDQQQNISTWLYEHNDYPFLESLFQAGLRSNPDWLMLSEVRGHEAKGLFKALSSGTPTITTIHARTVHEIKNRLLALLDLKGVEEYAKTQKELANYVHFYVQVRKYNIDQGIAREIEAIGLFYQSETKIYEQIIYHKNNDQKAFGDLPIQLADLIQMRSDWYHED